MDNLDDKKIEFTFGWLALQLLGKHLYSNAWSAIAELVANGFDAGAKNVYVYLNILKKEKATIEIFDDGSGMTDEDIETYAIVGHNKRLDSTSSESSTQNIMGRKGIGKLAALYLSDSYSILTKTTNKCSIWEMNYRKTSNDNDKPFLEKITHPFTIDCEQQWSNFQTGTLVKLHSVDLSGLGSVAFESLKCKLANYFALDSMEKQRIYLCIHKTNQTDGLQFEKLGKMVAFENMAYVACSDDKTRSENFRTPTTIKIPLDGKDGGDHYTHQQEIIPFSKIFSEKSSSNNSSGNQNSLNYKGIYKEIPYALNGWIGIHETIDRKKAAQRDPKFVKDSHYNPLQLRLYIRNKLAIENFINLIYNNQTFLTYIEGEISFDILDDDSLPDITTSNRQGLDEHEERVVHLKEIVSEIITSLIKKRQELANKVNEEKRKRQAEIDSSAKNEFGKELVLELNKTSLSADGKDELSAILLNKIKGDVKPKIEYTLFFSHSRKNKSVADFFYHILLERGVKQEEIFYTSRDNNVAEKDCLDSLNSQIRANILNENALLFYLPCEDYLKNQYCLFEGGAGWATRSASDYIILPHRYDDIPKFLCDGRQVNVLISGDAMSLSRQTYLMIRSTLNQLIDHINCGRRIQKKSSVERFNITDIPTDMKLQARGETLRDYMEESIVEHWQFYIESKSVALK